MHNLAKRNPVLKRVYDRVQNFISDTSAYVTRREPAAQPEQ